MSQHNIAGQRGISLEEAWTRIGVKKTKFYELLSEGEIESYHVGTRHLVVDASVDAWIDRRRSTSSKM
jgi:excisionase family DNA binding protein